MQSRWMSLVESVANVLVGYIVAVTTQYLVCSRCLGCMRPCRRT